MKGDADLLLPVHRHYLAYQYSSFCEDTLFYREAISQAQGHTPRPSSAFRSPVRIGIVSHHLLIRELIAEYFSLLADESDPGTIVIIGPNHRSRGKDEIAASRLTWVTPFGPVLADRSRLAGLLSAEIVRWNEDAFYDEHSIGSLVPFVRAYFPKARIIPLIVRADADSALMIRLAEWLEEHLDATDLVIGSIDFSHGMPSRQASLEDVQSLKILKSVDEARWRKVHADSRKTILLLLHLAQVLGARDFEVVHHTNSGILLGAPRDPCTSYINAIFRTSGD